MTAAYMVNAAAEIRHATERARQQAAWDTDVPRGCACGWRWHDSHWHRNQASTCRVHGVGQQMAQETR